AASRRCLAVRRPATQKRAGTIEQTSDAAVTALNEMSGASERARPSQMTACWTPLRPGQVGSRDSRLEVADSNYERYDAGVLECFNRAPHRLLKRRVFSECPSASRKLCRVAFILAAVRK